MKYFLALLAIMVFNGCAEIEPLVDYNPNTDFSVYRTFSVCDSYQVMDLQQDESISPEKNSVIEDVLREKLINLGYKDDQTGPDLLISYDLKFERQEVAYTICREKGDYEFWPECKIEKYPYTEGTMVVTIIDNAFDQVVWIGSLEDVWSNRSDKNFKAYMTKFIDVLFNDFPTLPGDAQN